MRLPTTADKTRRNMKKLWRKSKNCKIGTSNMENDRL